MSQMRKLARFITELTWEQIPEEIQRIAPLRVLDLVSSAAGASKNHLLRLIADSYEEREGLGNLTVWGYKKKYHLSEAAFLNGMLAHQLELDDVHPASKTHGSASLIPAAWVCAEYLGKSGKEFLTAVVAGYETAARVGMAFGAASHRKLGWHATSTCGVFGSAAACSKLLGLDEEQILWALGMAGTQSCGVWAFLGDGSSCKVLHTGRAASNGLEAAFLAKSGMTGPEHILEGEDGGLLRAMSEQGDATKLSAGLGSVWEIRNMDMKPYPCCRSSHCAADCALELRKKLDVSQIEEIQVETYQVGYQQCGVSEGCIHPKNTVEAKFSTPYVVAAAFLRGQVSAQEFTPEMVEDVQIQALLSRVHVSESAEFTAQYPKHWGCKMTVYLRDGSTRCLVVKDPSGSMARPLTKEQAMEKARGLLSAAYPGREQDVIGQILNLPEAMSMPELSI